MTDELTDDELSAIRAMVEYHRDIVYLDYWYNVDDVSKSPSSPGVKDNTIARLLDHIRAQDAANARLREALAAVCEGAVCTGEDGWQLCTICNEETRPSVTMRHAEDCPVPAAQDALAP